MGNHFIEIHFCLELNPLKIKWFYPFLLNAVKSNMVTYHPPVNTIL
jgi:hypothetical protein